MIVLTLPNREAVFSFLALFKSRTMLARVGLSNQAGRFPDRRAEAPTWGNVRGTWAKEKQPEGCWWGKALESGKARVHVEASVLIFGEGNGQRDVAAFVFHVIGFCPQIDQAGTLFLGKEPNLLGFLAVPESAVKGGNRDGLPVTDDAPDLFARTGFEIGSGLFRLQGRPLIEAEGLIHEAQNRFLAPARWANLNISLSAQGIPV